MVQTLFSSAGSEAFDCNLEAAGEHMPSLIIGRLESQAWPLWDKIDEGKTFGCGEVLDS